MKYSQLQALNAPNNHWIAALIGNYNMSPNWNWLTPTRNEIYFSFSPDVLAASRDQVSSSVASFLTVAQQSSVKHALNYIANLTGIQFIESSGSNADLFFANVDITSPNFSAMAVTLTTTLLKKNSDEIDQLSIEHFIYFDNAEFSKENLDLSVGSIGYETLLHELGHTLGLKHPFEGYPNLSLFEDTTFYTLMSYTHWGVKSTYSPFDLAALMYLYGGDGVGGRYGYLEDEHIIWGTNRSENIYGSADDEIFKSFEGNDQIDGGGGFDIAIYDSLSSQYDLKMFPTELILTSKNHLDGTDALTNIEKLQFSDRTIFVGSQPHQSYDDLPLDLYQFFITAFNAAPGVTYLDQMAEAYRYGLSIKQIVNIFTSKSQFTDLYPSSISHSEMATQLVNNIVKYSATSTAKSEAIADIKGALDIGWTVGDVIYTVFGNLANKSFSDKDWGNTAKQFSNEITVAKYYTEVLNQSTTDLETLRDVIQPVTQSTDISSDVVVAQLIGVALINGGLIP